MSWTGGMNRSQKCPYKSTCGIRGWLRVKYHYLDVLLVAIDTCFIYLQYRGVHVKYAQALRSCRLLRVVTLYTLYRRIKVYESRKWRLHAVTIRPAADGQIELRWDHCLPGEDRRQKGPFLLDHRVSNTL